MPSESSKPHTNQPLTENNPVNPRTVRDVTERKWFNEQQALLENTDPVLRDAPKCLTFTVKNPRTLLVVAPWGFPPLGVPCACGIHREGGCWPPAT